MSAPLPAPPDATVRAAIVAIDGQRALLGDAVVDAALDALRMRLAPARAAAPQRRHVSVLFLDVAGSTALSQKLDPEDIQAVLDGLLVACTDLVKQHGGKVLQYAGDSLLAVFGAYGERDDDAERAVHAGLALVDEGAARAVDVLQIHGHMGVHVRVGIHTGPVLLGGGLADANSIRGHTVHVAARMEQTAPKGRLRISHETWLRVRGVFDVQAQPPLAIKGQDAPVQTYLVVGAKPPALRVPARGISGAETALVGRDAELDQLVQAFERAAEHGGVHATLLLADAGLGKSRLLHELRHRLDAHPRSSWLLLGRARPDTAARPGGLLREILAWRLQIADDDSAETVWHKLLDGLGPLFECDSELQAALLGYLVGLELPLPAPGALAELAADPEALRQRALAAFKDYLRALSALDGAPLVMLLDDLHFADEASLAWLQALLHDNHDGDLSLALVMAARPDLLQRHPDWRTDWRTDWRSAWRSDAGSTALQIELAPLPDSERRVLARALLRQLAEPPASLLTLIEREAAGNPQRAEALVQRLIDDGAIRVELDAWQVVPERLGATLAPPPPPAAAGRAHDGLTSAPAGS